MKVLFLAPYVPYPVLHGGRNRILGLVHCLTRFAEVRVLAVGDPQAPEAAESRERLAALGVPLEVFQPTGLGADEADAQDVARLPDALAHFRCPGLLEALPRVFRAFEPDVVQFAELVMAQYASAVPSPRVIDRQKVEWAYHEAMAVAEDEASAAHRREAIRFRKLEARVAGQFTNVLVIGEGDKRILQPFYGQGAIHVIPIGVDDAIRRPSDRTSAIRHALLYGTLDYAPNVEANALYFREVWPALSRTLPDLRTVVVGSGQPPASLPASDPRVELLGYVPGIAAVLEGPGALVVPLRVGGGARTKILEALAAGMPVVSTAVGVENLGLEPGRHYLRAETPEEMVEAVVRLARHPELTAALGREGSALVDRVYRWDAIGRLLEPIYRGMARSRTGEPRPSTARKRALLVGVRPLPHEHGARGLSFPGHRTAQFRSALVGAECEVLAVLLDEDPEVPPVPLESEGTAHVLAPELFRGGQELQRLHDAFEPDVLLSAGGYHTARALAQLATDRPRWIDLAGDLAAEGQARALGASDGVLADYLSVLSRALLVGDRFSVVGPSQRLALLGQLGLSGRLIGSTLGDEPVDVVPLAADGPEAAAPLPADGFRVLWSGGYNVWMDAATLFEGLEKAMARRDDIVFVSTGGAIAGHDEESHGSFWSRARASPFADRFQDRGRAPRREALAILDECHLVLSISRPCLEAELGSRQRLVEGMAHGRPVVTTRLGDVAAEIVDAGAGLALPPGDASALAEAVLQIAEDRERLEACARSARSLWQRRFTPEATTAPIRSWIERPTRWPRSVVEESGLARLAGDRLRLQAELDAIRGSITFRALRLLDRLLGRGGPSQ